MLAASQDIDNFIERQRSKLNKTPNRQQVNRPTPPPPPPRPPPPMPAVQQPPQGNLHDRLDFKVARILDEPPPRVQQQQQPYYPPSPPPFTGGGPPVEQQAPYYPEQRRFSGGDGGRVTDDNPTAFFERFGTYDEKRSQLKDDLKREYNDYLRSQQRGSKSKSTSQLVSPRTSNNNNRRVQFQQQSGTVVAPWEKKDGKGVQNSHSMNDLSSTMTTSTREFTSSNRSRPQGSSNQDEQYIRDREEYILELHTQIRELEARRKQLEMEGGMMSTGSSSNVARAHHSEDLSALNTLLAQRVSQRNAVDHELARILNRPPVSTSPTRISSGGVSGFDVQFDRSSGFPPPERSQQQRGRGGGDPRNEFQSAPKDEGFQIGQQTDKDAEQAAKKRYQHELQAQMREAQMRKVQAKQEKDQYDRKLEAEIQSYNYFGRGGGGAPMRDKDGNVVANLADLRNPPQQQNPSPRNQQQQQQQQQQYGALSDKVYSLGGGTSAITDAPYYNGDPQNPSNSARPTSPNHARGAVNNGIFGTTKTDAQRVQEEKYKLDLKRQIDEKRQRNADEIARRRAEEERELAKHKEWNEQMERQTADEALRKQEKEVLDREHQQQLQEEFERQRQQEENVGKRKPKRPEKPSTPKHDEHDGGGQGNFDEQQQYEPHGAAYRSSSPPVPTLKNKGKKQKANNNSKRPSFDDASQLQPPLAQALDTNNTFSPPPFDDNDGQGRQTYRKPPTPRQQEPPGTRKKPPQTFRARPRANSNSNMPMRTNSMTSLRSDGSDSEVLNRLEHLKRQLKDKEERLQKHVDHHNEGGLLSDIEERSTIAYRPPSPSMPRKQSPGFLLNAARVHHRESPTTHDKLLRVLHADDDDEFKPSYFRDDSILMRGGAGAGHIDHDFVGSSKRVDLVDGIFVTDLEAAARRRRYGTEPPGYFDRENPTSMASLELNRIVQQNEQRLKKLRDLESDDASLLDSNEVLERFQQKQRLQGRGSQTTLQDDAWLK